MKRCTKEPEEPVCLTEFRTAQPSADWDRFKAEAQECYSEVRDKVRATQGCLCAYCEMRLNRNNEQVAHFHPKSDRDNGHNWALDWRNLWLACNGGTQSWLDDHTMHPLPQNRSCDENKENRCLDGLILRPDEIPAFPRLFCYRQWPDRLDIHPDEKGCTEASIDVETVQRTIDELNLNCRQLAEARLPLHRELERAKKHLRQSGADPKSGLDALADRHLSHEANDGCRKAFFTVIRWSLGVYAESYLHKNQYFG